MVSDYVSNYYLPARDQAILFKENNSQIAKSLAEWKKKINAHWDGVTIKAAGEYGECIKDGDTLPVLVNANLNGLTEDDVAVECLVGEVSKSGNFLVHDSYRFDFVKCNAKLHQFELQLKPPMPGLSYFKLRIYPYHKNLSHPFETGKMIWI
jgi:starch phosphorylase